MKSIFLYITFFIFSLTSISQTIDFEVNVFDSLNLEKLPFVSIGFKELSINFTSNLDGLVKQKIDTKGLKNDTLIITYFSYQTEIIGINLSDNININIKLISTANYLDDVVIQYEKPITEKEILKNVIRNTETNYDNQSVNLVGLYRESLKLGNEYKQLNEAVINLHYTQYPVKNYKGNIWEDWLYDDTYAFESSRSFLDGFPNQFNTKEDKVEIIEARSSEDFTYKELLIVGGPLSLTSKDYIKYQTDFLDPHNFKEYVYKKKGVEEINGRKCYVIHFHPKEHNQHIRIWLGRKPNYSIYVGEMYIDTKSFALVKMQFKISSDINFGFYSSRIANIYQFCVEYKETDSKWHLHKIEFTQKRGNGKFSIETKQELFIQEIKRKEVQQILLENEWKHTSISSLRTREIPYQADFWENYTQTIDYPQLAEKLVLDLEKEKSLEEQFKNRFQQRPDLLPPTAMMKKQFIEYPEETLTDNYHWFTDTANQTELYDYLQKENEYASNYMIPLKERQKKFFEKMNSFYIEDTTHQSNKAGDYEQITDSTGNILLVEYLDSVKFIKIFNLSNFYFNHPEAFILNMNISNKNIGIKYTSNGSLNNQMILYEKGNERVIDSLADIHDYVQFNDTTILYTPLNHIKRCEKLCLRNIIQKKDSVLMHEPDSTFDICIKKTPNFIICSIESKIESEIYISSNKELSFKLIKPRKSYVTNTVKEFNGEIYILSNENSPYNSISKLNKQGEFEEFVPNKKNRIIEDFYLTSNFIVLKTRKNTFTEITYKTFNEKKWNKISFDQKIISVDFNSSKDDKLFINYASPNTPYQLKSIDLFSGKTEIERSTKINFTYKYNLKYIESKRIYARAKDGKKIPLTILTSRNPTKKHNGLILKAYGCYGSLYGTGYFSMEDAILLNDGFTIVYVHVRGDGIHGEKWHRAGQKDTKKNTFSDFIAAAEYLIKKGYTDESHLVAYGNSAGGMLMGNVINQRPELFKTVILDHPYLDVLNGMMNPKIPLTIDHYKEIGNPNEVKMYNYIKSYCPYQNISPQLYPNLLYLAGSNDYQTPVNQIAKHVAKIRANNTGENEILFITDFGSGHAGSTIGKDYLKIISLKLAFIYETLFP
jgi:protease II